MSDVRQRPPTTAQEPGDLLFALAAATPDAMHVKDLEGRYLFVNEACARMMGRSVHEIIGRTDAVVFPQVAAQRIEARDRVVRDGGQTITFIEHLDIPGPGLRTFHTTKGPIRSTDGRLYATFGISRDITQVEDAERDEANRSLRESEMRYRTLVNAMRDGVFVAQNHRFVLVNDAMETLLGYERGGMRDLPFAAVVAPRFLAQWIERFERRIAGRNPPGIYDVGLLRRAGGEPLLFELNANLVDYDGMPAVLGIVRDISERRRLEHALMERGELEDRLAHVVATAPGVVHAFHVRPDGGEQFLFAGPGIEKIYGIGAEALCRDASMIAGMTHAEDRDRVRTAYQAAIRAHTPFHEEFRVSHPSRGDIWVDIHSLPRPHPDGGLTFTGFITDITERKRRELARQEQTQEMLDQANDSIIVRGPGNVILYWNGGAERLYGWRADEAVGQVAHDLLQTEFAVPLAEIERQLRAGGHWSGEFVHRRRDGERIVVSSQLTAKLDQNGDIMRVLAINQDVTERKRTEEQIRELNARLSAHSATLEAQNRELEAFSYSVSHDLKAPLRGIDGYSRLLLDEHADRLDEEGRLFVATIRRATQQMGHLIDDLLAYARVDRREAVLTEASLVGLVEQLVSERRGEIDARAVEIVLDLQVDRIRTEAEGLALVMRNLLDNAFKFTKATAGARIVVRSRMAGRRIRIEVEDNGVGFEMKYHDRIFEIFQRLHRADEYPGTGIGLAIVRKSVERLGGRVWADSAPGRGSVFCFELPGMA